ncbi:hypothetical protein WDU94_005504 [Cyamophila willieti]
MCFTLNRLINILYSHTFFVPLTVTKRPQFWLVFEAGWPDRPADFYQKFRAASPTYK